MRAITVIAVVLTAVLAGSSALAQDVAFSEVWLGDQAFVELVNTGDGEVSLADVWIATAPEAAGWPAGEGAATRLDDVQLAAGELALVAVGDRSSVAAPDGVVVVGSLNQAEPEPNGAGGILWLFVWDGATDLVADLDVIRWGEDAPALEREGVVVDGPDDDDEATAYAADTPAQMQAALPALVLRGAIRREPSDPTVGEGGNGVDGGDETAEALDETWGITGTPTPGAENVEDLFAVSGRVVRDGRAVLGLPVVLSSGDETLSTTTGSSGFRFDELPRAWGAFELVIGEGDDAITLEGEIDDANVRFDVDASADVEVTVRAELVARAAPDVSVTASLSAEPPIRAVAPAGDPLVFRAVMAGTYELEVEAFGFETATERLDVTGPTDALVSLYPAAPVRLDLQVLSQGGAPANGATVYIDGVGYRAGVSRQAVVSEGAVRFEDVPPGFYRVRATLAAESVDIESVDVLAASQMVVRMSSAAVDPPVSTVSNCTSGAGGASWAAWLIAAAVLVRRRRC